MSLKVVVAVVGMLPVAVFVARFVHSNRRLVP